MTRAEIVKLAGLASGAKKRANTHCARGHEYTPENTKLTAWKARQCLACYNMKNREWKEKNKNYVARLSRNRTLLKKYGLTSDQVDDMIASQGGACAICKSTEPGRHGWHVDHCHTTGRVREALCSRCNQGLGLFRDDTALMAVAIEYLRKHAA